MIKLENKSEGFTKYAYTGEFKKLENVLDKHYKDMKLTEFSKTIDLMRNHWLDKHTLFNQLELKL